MNKEEKKDYIKSLEPTFLEQAPKKVNGYNTYVCPNCGNGSGKNGDGIVLDIKGDGKHYKCFRCGLYEDVIGLYKAKTGIKNDKEAFDNLYKAYGLEDEIKPKKQHQNQTKSDQIKYKHTERKEIEKKPAQEKEDFTNLFLEANKNIDNTTYLKDRGITNKELIDRFKIGYIENWKHPKTPNAPATNRLIIPLSSSSYTAINTKNKREMNSKEQEYRYQKAGTGNRIFNVKALKTAKSPIWIVEGEIDALSIYEAGGEAIALSSVSNANTLINLLKQEKPAQSLVLLLDNDNAGKDTTNKLVQAFKEIGIKHYVAKVKTKSTYKDANDLLLRDREALKLMIEEAKEFEEQEEEEIKEAYLKTSTAYHIQDFINGITNSVNTPFIPTGFKFFDQILEGGLYEGLYVLGAVSSLGKTTFLMQVADQIAEAGTDVLIFSLEMARTEIMSKSISRLTLLDVMQNNRDLSLPKTSRGITTGSRYKYYSEEEINLIKNATETYSNYASRIYIHEGIGNIGVKEIKATVEKHIKITGNRPVVIIDYLQILAPRDIRATDKQNTDIAVLELKRLSRDYKLPVVAISSINRNSYKGGMTMAAYKESGAIEYSSDVLMGLQFKGADEKEFNEKEAYKQDPREIELKILKNRNGATRKTISYAYYPMFNYFDEEELEQEEKEY